VRRSIRANAGATGPYLIAYAVTLASFTVIWFNYPIYLYIGRDASLSLWLARTYGTWAYPFDVTAMNPFQGMTSMLMAVNPYFNPGTWIFQTGLPEVPKQVVFLETGFGASCGSSDFNMITEISDAVGESGRGLGRITASEVFGAEVLVASTITQHVIDGCQD